MRGFSRLACVVMLASWPTTVLAQSDSPSKLRPIVELGFGPDLGVRFTNDCHHGGSDVGMCGTTSLLFFHVFASWRASWEWSLGGRLSGSPDTSTLPRQHWWWVEAEARWHPLSPGTADLWLGVDGGAVQVIDEFTEGVEGNTRPAYRHDTAAPVLGASVGVDWPVAGGCCALGPELRAYTFLFGNDPDSSRFRSHTTQSVVALGVNFTFLVGRR